jgi:Fur family peroxide stress response transcriptional regulator
MGVGKAGVEQRVESFKAATRKAGVKLTHQRIEIFREIASSIEHPDAETVFRAVQKRLPTVSLDTVYRTLWTLNELGLIVTLGPRRGRARFDANLKQHHHYVCVHCGRTCDFESAELNRIRIPRTAQGFGSIVSAHVEVRGICRTCSKKDGHEETLVSWPKGPERTGL